MPTRVATGRTERRTFKATVSALALAGAIAVAPMAAPLPAFAYATPESFAGLIDEVAPAVVQITAKQVSEKSETAGTPQLPEQLPDGMRDFLERFFGQQFPDGLPGGPGGRPHGRMPGHETAALGSGFIISSDGIVVTNNHVVGDAKSIEVTLKDGSTYTAKLLGKDEKTDLAVLKIDADRSLPTVSWGDSSDTKVGDWVVAVGNPFGLTGTVTAGIVSSRGRDIGAGPYDDFIQIDAPLNTGNSGGPLFDHDGKVIGVNTAIYSPNGGNVGIGFAIPSDIARKVVAELEQKGSVERGWLGVAIQPVTPDVAESLGLKEAEGALVATVMDDSPAAKAGIQQGDVVLKLDGKDVESPRDLSRAVADTAAGTKSNLVVWRDNREVSLNVHIGEMPKQQEASLSPDRSDSGSQTPGVQLGALGLTLAPLDDAARNRFGLSEDLRGAVVAAVSDDGNAAEKGLRPGDVITRVNQEKVSAPSDVVNAVDRAKSEHRKSVLLLIDREGDQRFVAVELATA